RAPAIAPPMDATESASPPTLAANRIVASADLVMTARFIAKGTFVSGLSGKHLRARSSTVKDRHVRLELLMRSSLDAVKGGGSRPASLLVLTTSERHEPNRRPKQWKHQQRRRLRRRWRVDPRELKSRLRKHP